MVNSNECAYPLRTLNPDGLNYVWTKDNWWRKNRRQNPNRSFGVDLNRNYNAGWNLSCSGSTSPSSETYKGPSPNSEPETKVMVAFQEDRKFAKVLDFHSYAEEVRPGYGSCGKMPAVLKSMFDSYGSELASKISYRRTTSCCMAGDIAHAFQHHGSLSILIETGRAFQPPEAEMRRVVKQVWPGTLYFLNLPIAIHGHVTDSNGKPLRAQLVIDKLQFSYNEKFYSDEKRFGRYHLWIPQSGSYDVTFIADGYVPLKKTVTASMGKVDVVLQKA